MKRRAIFYLIVLDLVAGLLAFAISAIVGSATGSYQDVRPFGLAVAVTFFMAAFYRAISRPKDLAYRALFVTVGGILPAILINRRGIALTTAPYILIFLTMEVLSVIVGAYVRFWWTKKRQLQGLLVGCLWIALILATIFEALPTWLDSHSYLTVDRPINPFLFQKLNGQTVTSQDLKGNVVVISFWATWCLPCRAELPELEAVEAHYRNNQDVRFLALDPGTGGDTAADALAFLKRRNLNIPAGIDGIPEARQGMSSAAQSLGVQSLPATYVLDRSGNLRVIHSGHLASEHLSTSLPRQIDRLLANN